ncbi:MAG: DNA polymerase III subunit delta' [bacterium]|nr:DNA polymerase III subunit delta' [bacterium]
MLSRWVAGGRLAHAYLFCGPPGMGKLGAARELAKLLNCERSAPGAFCGCCPSCLRIDRGNHPEVRVVAAEGATTKLGQVREVCRELHLRPAFGHRRVYILEDADRLTTEAANALLAVLEEPPGHAVLVLLASHAQALLPTIVSRCQTLSFRPWPQESLARLLEAEDGAAPGPARLAAALAQGNPGLARSRLADDQLGAGREQAERMLERLLEDPEGTGAHILAGDLEAYTRDRAGTLAFLDVLLLYLRDFLTLKVAGRPELLINQDRAGWIGARVAELSPDQLLDALGAAAFVRDAVRQNAHRRMCLDLLVLRLTRGRRRGRICPGL